MQRKLPASLWKDRISAHCERNEPTASAVRPILLLHRRASLAASAWNPRDFEVDRWDKSSGRWLTRC